MDAGADVDADADAGADADVGADVPRPDVDARARRARLPVYVASLRERDLYFGTF
ncbi:MAG: hypothetical protein JO061_02530 [Acidobacteriaceae bacterium]|nr:hypothetical protein [Acidobacteriaceae bacterium]